MLRILLLLAAFAGAAATGVMRIDPDKVKAAMDSMRLPDNLVGQWQEQTQDDNRKVVAASGVGDRKSGATKTAVPKDEPQTPDQPKAFYNILPKECHWEKIIDPSTGTVECSVQQRQSRK